MEKYYYLEGLFKKIKVCIKAKTIDEARDLFESLYHCDCTCVKVELVN